MTDLPFGKADYRELSRLMEEMVEGNTEMTGKEFLVGIKKACNGDYYLIQRSWTNFLNSQRVRPRCINCLKLIPNKGNTGGRWAYPKDTDLSGTTKILFCRYKKGTSNCYQNWTHGFEKSKEAAKELKAFMKMAREISEHYDD